MGYVFLGLALASSVTILQKVYQLYVLRRKSHTVDFSKAHTMDQFNTLMTAEQTQMESGIERLAKIGNASTLVGLGGTMVTMFQTLSFHSDPVKLAEGVSQAMSFTAYGLLVAVPSLIAYTILQNRVNGLSSKMADDGLAAYLKAGIELNQ